jgi:hypothetical protein
LVRVDATNAFALLECALHWLIEQWMLSSATGVLQHTLWVDALVLLCRACCTLLHACAAVS